MDWSLYWVIVWQVVLACVILAFPLSIVAFFLTGAISSGMTKKDTRRVL